MKQLQMKQSYKREDFFRCYSYDLHTGNALTGNGVKGVIRAGESTIVAGQDF